VTFRHSNAPGGEGDLPREVPARFEGARDILFFPAVFKPPVRI
jgi:hypothetical protein